MIITHKIQRRIESEVERLFFRSKAKDSAGQEVVRLREALQGIIDWADFALSNPDTFNKSGVRNLDGPAFDTARAALSADAAQKPKEAPITPENQQTDKAESEQKVAVTSKEAPIYDMIRGPFPTSYIALVDKPPDPNCVIQEAPKLVEDK